LNTLSRNHKILPLEQPVIILEGHDLDQDAGGFH